MSYKQECFISNLIKPVSSAVECCLPIPFVSLDSPSASAPRLDKALVACDLECDRPEL